MNKLKLIHLIILGSICTTAFADINVDEMTKQISKNLYYRDKNIERDVQLQEIDNILQQLNAGISQDPKNPVYWYLKSLASWSRVVILGETLTSQEVQDLKQPVFESYRKALEVDNPDNPKLNLDMLYSLKNFGSSDVHVEAAQRILDEGPKLESREEIELRGGMIQHLLRLERYDDVMKQIEIIEQRYPNTEYAKGARNHYTKVIAEAKERQQTENKPEEKESPVVEESKQPEAVTQQPVEKPQLANGMVDPYVSEEAEYKRYILILALLAVGIAVIVYLIRRPRKK